MSHLDLHHTQLRGQWYLDHIIAQKGSKNQNTGAYIFTNRHFTKAYPIERHNNTFAAMSLHEFCTDAGTHGRLKSDRAPKLVGCNSEFYKPAHKRYMDLTYAKPKHKNQIWCVDLEIRELKKCARNKMV